MRKEAFCDMPMMPSPLQGKRPESRKSLDADNCEADLNLSKKAASQDSLELNGDLRLRIPKTLHKRLWEAAILEGVPLEKYIIYKLTQ